MLESIDEEVKMQLERKEQKHKDELEKELQKTNDSSTLFKKIYKRNINKEVCISFQ